MPLCIGKDALCPVLVDAFTDEALNLGGGLHLRCGWHSFRAARPVLVLSMKSVSGTCGSRAWYLSTGAAMTKLEAESLPGGDGSAGEEGVGLDKCLIEKNRGEGGTLSGLTAKPVAQCQANDEGDQLLRLAAGLSPESVVLSDDGSVWGDAFGGDVDVSPDIEQKGPVGALEFGVQPPVGVEPAGGFGGIVGDYRSGELVEALAELGHGVGLDAPSSNKQVVVGRAVGGVRMAEGDARQDHVDSANAGGDLIDGGLHGGADGVDVVPAPSVDGVEKGVSHSGEPGGLKASRMARYSAADAMPVPRLGSGQRLA